MSRNVVMDIDGCLANFEQMFCDHYSYYEDRHLIDLCQRLPYKTSDIRQWVADPRTYIHLRPIMLGLKIADTVSNSDFDLCLVSSRPEAALLITADWLKFHGVKFSTLSVNNGNKVDVIKKLRPIMVIDDIPAILENSRKLTPFPLIFDNFWNKDCDFLRISSYKDFEKIWDTLVNCDEYMGWEYGQTTNSADIEKIRPGQDALDGKAK